MESAGDDVEDAGDAAVTQPTRVLDVFVVEEIEGADADPGRRKTGEILAAAGTQMSLAWQQPPIATDSGMNLGTPYPRDRSTAARATCIDVMRRQL